MAGSGENRLHVRPADGQQPERGGAAARRAGKHAAHLGAPGAAQDAGGTKSLFEAAREQELRELNRKASAAANNSVDYVRRRLERNDRDAEIYEWALRRLNELDGVIPYEGPDDAECEALGPVRTVRPEKPGERERMQALMERNRPMSDFAAASYMRGLVSVTERVSKMLGDGAEDSGIVVVLPEDKGAFE